MREERPFKPTRRKVLGATGLLGLASLLPWSPLNRMFGLDDTALAASTPGGELYAGFLLLPEGTPPPASVKYPKGGTPIMCGIGGQKTTAISRHFDSQQKLQKALPFPMYTLSRPPHGAVFHQGYVIEHTWGNVFAASVNFHAINQDMKSSHSVATIWAEPEYPRPFPYWIGPSSALDTHSIAPEKVSFLPSPGLMVYNPRISHAAFYWIKDNVSYRLTINDVSAEQAKSVATSLVRL